MHYRDKISRIFVWIFEHLMLKGYAKVLISVKIGVTKIKNMVTKTG
jgi:hypothetical protein